MRTSTCLRSKLQVSDCSAAGFTLIEMLVTLGILAILSSIMIGYASESGRQTFLLVTRESVVQLLNRAKADALAQYSTTVSGGNSSSLSTCGFGVHVDRAAYTLTIFESESTDCDHRSNYSFSSSTDILLTGSLDSYVIDSGRLQFIQDPDGDLTDVVFTSPNSQTYINGATSNTVTQAGVDLQMTNAASENIKVTINNAGQISW